MGASATKVRIAFRFFNKGPITTAGRGAYVQRPPPPPCVTDSRCPQKHKQSRWLKQLRKVDSGILPLSRQPHHYLMAKDLTFCWIDGQQISLAFFLNYAKIKFHWRIWAADLFSGFSFRNLQNLLLSPFVILDEKGIICKLVLILK